MNFSIPKDNDKYSWTKHSLEKMKFYGLSVQRVLRVLNHPERVEEAVAPGCLAGLQTVGNKKKTEIWIMWKEQGKSQKAKVKNNEEYLDQNWQKLKGKSMDLINNHKKIITAWRYPGVSPIKSGVPVPEDILRELEKMDNGNY